MSSYEDALSQIMAEVMVAMPSGKRSHMSDTEAKVDSAEVKIKPGGPEKTNEARK